MLCDIRLSDDFVSELYDREERKKEKKEERKKDYICLTQCTN